MDSKIREIIKNHTKTSDFDSDSDLQMDLDLDSLNLVCLTVELEDSFEITFNESDIPNILTVGDIEKYVKKQLDKK